MKGFTMKGFTMKGLFFVIFTLGLSSANAAEITNFGGFVGVDGGYGFLNEKFNSNKGNDSLYRVKDNNFNLGFRVGFHLYEEHRFYVGYNHQFEAAKTNTSQNATSILNYSPKFDSDNFIFGYDFTPAIPEYFRLVLGAYGGYSRAALQGKATTIEIGTGTSVREKIKRSLNGFVYGGKIGGLINFGQGELEMGVKIQNAHYFDYRYEANVGFLKSKPEAFSMGVYAGVNFKF